MKCSCLCVSLVSRYELKRAEYVTKLPKGKHSVKGDTAAFIDETLSLIVFRLFCWPND